MIIYALLTNDIPVLWRCRSRGRRHFLNSLIGQPRRSTLIHLIPKWPPFRYSFVFIEIRPWCLVQGKIFFWIFSSRTRHQGLIWIKTKEYLNDGPFWNKVYGHPLNWHYTFRNNYTTKYPILIWQAYRWKNERKQAELERSTRYSVSKLSRADLQYLGLKTPLKTVNFQLFCWVLLFQYSKKCDFPGACLVSLVDIGNCKAKSSICVQLFASPLSPIVNLFSLIKMLVSLK